MEESTAKQVYLPTPLMHKEKFAELVGVSFGVVEGWADRGYLPTKVIGKHKLINIALLTQECLEELPR